MICCAKCAWPLKYASSARHPESLSPYTGTNGSAATAKPSPLPVRTTPVIPSDQRFPVVVLGASTGGPATVMRLAPGFTRDFPAAVFLCSTCRRLHHAIRRHNSPNSPASASRKRKWRGRAGRHPIYMSRRAAPSRQSHRPHSARWHIRPHRRLSSKFDVTMELSRPTPAP